MYSSFPLYLLYLLFKVSVRISFALFYPNTRVVGREHLKLEGPTLIATNHPNTLIDALNAASRVDEQVYFLVNAGLYEKPWQARLFDALFCIPIERPQDAKGRPVRNQEAFARCDAHLGRGGHIFVAPEGSSEMEYRLRRIKTGTARIALSAASKADFQLGLRILPIGLTYGDPPHMGSSLLVQAGTPIPVKEYATTYGQNPRQAVHDLTEALRRSLSNLIPDTRDEAEERMYKQIDTLLQREDPRPLEEAFTRNKSLVRKLRSLRERDPQAWEVFRGRLRRYFLQLEEAGLNDKAFTQPSGPLWHALGLLLSFPLFVAGCLPNALPYFLPKRVERKMDLYIGYAATVKILLGLITFPLTYAFFFWLTSQWIPSMPALVLTLALIPLGYFAWYWVRWLRQTRLAFRYHRLRRKRTSIWKDMRQERAWLVDRLLALWEEKSPSARTAG